MPLTSSEASREQTEIALEAARISAAQGDAVAARTIVNQALDSARASHDEQIQVEALIELLRMPESLALGEAEHLARELQGLLAKVDSRVGEWEVLRVLSPALVVADERVLVGGPLDGGELYIAQIVSGVDAGREVLLETFPTLCSYEELERDALLSKYLHVQSRGVVPQVLIFGRLSDGKSSYLGHACVQTQQFPGGLLSGGWEAVCNFMVTTINTLQLLHGLGHVHGDLRRRTVRVGPNNTPVLVGFSAARSAALVRAAITKDSDVKSLGGEDARGLAAMMHRWLQSLSRGEVSHRQLAMRVPPWVKSEIARVVDEGGYLTELQTLFMRPRTNEPIPWIGRSDVVDQAIVALKARRLVRIVGGPGSGRSLFLRELERRIGSPEGARVFRLYPPSKDQLSPLENVEPALDLRALVHIPGRANPAAWDVFVDELVRVHRVESSSPRRDHARPNVVVLVPHMDEDVRLDSATSSLLDALVRRAASDSGDVCVVCVGPSAGDSKGQYEVVELRDLTEVELEELFDADALHPSARRRAARALYVRTGGRPASTLEELQRWVRLGFASAQGTGRWRVRPFGLAGLELDPVLAPAVDASAASGPAMVAVNDLPALAREVLAVLCIAGPGYPVELIHTAMDGVSAAKVLFLTENCLERLGLVRSSRDRISFMSLVPFILPAWTEADVRKRRSTLANGLRQPSYRRFWLFYHAIDMAALDEAVALAVSLRAQSEPEGVPTLVRFALALLDREARAADERALDAVTASAHRLRLMQQWVLAALDALSAAELAQAISELLRARSSGAEAELENLRLVASAINTLYFARGDGEDAIVAYKELERLVPAVELPDLGRIGRLAMLAWPKLSPTELAQRDAEMRTWIGSEVPQPEQRRYLVKLENRLAYNLYLDGRPWEALCRYELHAPDEHTHPVEWAGWLISLVKAELELFDRLDAAREHIAKAKAVFQRTPSPVRELELTWVELLLDFRTVDQLQGLDMLRRWDLLERQYQERLQHERLHFFWLQHAGVLYHAAKDPSLDVRQRDALLDRARLIAGRLVVKDKVDGFSQAELVAKALRYACGVPLEYDEVKSLLNIAKVFPHRLAAIQAFGLLGLGVTQMNGAWRDSLMGEGLLSLEPYAPLLRRFNSPGARKLRRATLSINEALAAWGMLDDRALSVPAPQETFVERLRRFFVEAFTQNEIVELLGDLGVTSAVSGAGDAPGDVMGRAVLSLREAGRILQLLVRLEELRPARAREVQFMRSLWAADHHQSTGDAGMTSNTITMSLDALLRELFDEQGLRRFLYAGQDGREVVQSLPGAPAPLRELSFHAALALDQRGLINDQLFQRLLDERPAKEAKVIELWRMVNPDPPIIVRERPVAPLPPPPPPQVTRLTIAIGQGEWKSDLAQGGGSFHCEISVGQSTGVGTFSCPWDETRLDGIRRQLRSMDVRPSTEELLEWGFALREGFKGLDPFMGRLPLGLESVEVELRLNHASLLLLPWELMVPFIGPDARFIVLFKNTALFRSVPRYYGTPARALRLDAPVLFAWSNAGGPVPYKEHRRELIAAVGAERLFEVKDASLRSIREKYSEVSKMGRSPTALHLLCHGVDVGESSYGLRLHGPAAGSVAAVEGAMLQSLLSDHLEGVSLLSVASCFGGDIMDWRSPVGSVAQIARSAGVDVVASQFPMSSEASTIVARELYESLFVRRHPLIVAHQRTVSVLHQDLDETLDWASLVLLKVN
jgi:hypothetical protein